MIDEYQSVEMSGKGKCAAGWFVKQRFLKLPRCELGNESELIEISVRLVDVQIGRAHV